MGDNFFKKIEIFMHYWENKRSASFPPYFDLTFEMQTKDKLLLSEYFIIKVFSIHRDNNFDDQIL